MELFQRLNRCHPRERQRVQNMIHKMQRMEEEEKEDNKKEKLKVVSVTAHKVN